MRRSFLLAVLGLAVLTQPVSVSLAGGPKKGDPPPPVVTAPKDPATLTDKEIAKALEPFTVAITTGDKNAATEALLTLLKDPAQAVYHGIAWGQYANMLRAADMEYASLLAAGQAITLDPTHNANQVKGALASAAKVSDTAYLEHIFSNNVGLDVDKELRGQLAYLGARGAFYDGHYTTAIGILALVPKDDPNYAKAVVLKGILQSRLGKYSDAMATLVVGQTLVGSDPELLDLVNLNLGRTYYAAENYARSIEYYSLVSRDSEWWPEAQFEKAWSHFRLDDVNGALGILQTHAGPFYADWYFPEAQLLRIYSLFLMCKFPEASKQVTLFQEQWTPVRDSLGGTISGMDEAAVFADAKAYIAGEQHKLPEMVLRHTPADERLKDAITAVDKADAEIARLKQRSEPWAQDAATLVSARRDALIKAEGGRIKSTIEGQVATLTAMLTDTEISKLDMLSLETQLYTQAAATGELAEVEEKAQRDVRVRKGYVSWPYEGEIWADEIGYTKVNAKPECPQGLMRGTEKK